MRMIKLLIYERICIIKRFAVTNFGQQKTNKKRVGYVS